VRREHVPADVDGKHVAEAAHPGLRREMEDTVDAVEVERLLCEVESQDVEPACVLFLLGRVVVVREAVDAHDLVTRRDELLCEVRADEAGGSCDDVPHFGTIPYTVP
jgi:hypothetical protein